MSVQRMRFLASFLVVVWLMPIALAQDTDEYFKANCSSCHTIGGGRLAGPDLKDVESRQERAWLIKFILDPQGVIDSGDPYAAKIFEAARFVPMPRAAGISRERAIKLIDLIAAESKLPESRFAGIALSDRPFTDNDVVEGRELFSGHRRLVNGGPSCISCHSMAGLSGLGGGLLGPDLTDAYARLDGRKALGAWLTNPATETMAPVYAKHPLDKEEVLPLLAYMEDAAEKGAPAHPTSGIEFLVLGLIGAAVSLVGCDIIWKRRFTGVREGVLKGNS